MSSDQFSLWLNNKHLFKELNDETFKLQQNEIISFFGGFKEMVNLCMNNQFNIDLIKHQKLFKLLDQFKTQQNVRMLNNKSKTKQTVIKKPKLSLLNIHDIAISLIFTFLDKSDHISFGQTCNMLTIIGRRRDSFIINQIDHSYRYFGSHLEFQHKLSYIINLIESHDPNNWQKSINSLLNINYDWIEVEVIMHSGVIPLLFDLFHKSQIKEHTDICVNIFNFFEDECLPYSAKNVLFVKYGIFPLITNCINNINDPLLISECINILNYLLSNNKSYAVILNHLNFFSIFVHKMEELCFKFESIRSDDIINILDIVEPILTSSSFKYDTNKSVLLRFAHFELFNWIKILCDENEDISIPSDQILRIYSKINTNYDIKFDICDQQKMSLILFLLQHKDETATNNRLLVNVINQWLDIDIALLLNTNICDFMLNNIHLIINKLKIYLKLLSNINQCKASKHRSECFERMRNCIFQYGVPEIVKEIEVFLEEYFSRKNIQKHCIDFMVELVQMIENHRVQQIAQMKETIFDFLRENKIFGNMMCIQLTSRPKQALQFVFNTMKSSIFGAHWKLILMQNPCKIYQSIINASYSGYNVLGIQCCLELSWIYFEKMISSRIVYVFQDFIVQFNRLCNAKHLENEQQIIHSLMYDVIGKLDEYRNDTVVSKQLWLNISIKQSILDNNTLSTELIQFIMESNIWKENNICFYKPCKHCNNHNI